LESLFVTKAVHDVTSLEHPSYRVGATQVPQQIHFRFQLAPILSNLRTGGWTVSERMQERLWSTSRYVWTVTASIYTTRLHCMHALFYDKSSQRIRHCINNSKSHAHIDLYTAYMLIVNIYTPETLTSYR